LWQGERRLDLSGAAVDATSEYPGHSAAQVLAEDTYGTGVAAALSMDELRALGKCLTVDGRKLDLAVTLYTHQLKKGILPYLKHCDVVSLWTWRASDLARLEENFAQCKRLLPGKRILLGLYMWDFGTRRPMPPELMKKQCTLALKWLREGRIEGMIFLATNICDLDLEAVNWSRSWIAKVGGQPLVSARSER
jgi:hypothetical protein